MGSVEKKCKSTPCAAMKHLLHTVMAVWLQSVDQNVLNPYGPNRVRINCINSTANSIKYVLAHAKGCTEDVRATG